MFKKLAEIANKLDGLGLTKEADVLDLYLKKIAAGGPYAEAPGDAEALQAVNNLPYMSDIPAGLNVTTDLAEKKKVGPAPTSWAEYSTRVGGTNGSHIQNLWKLYANVVGASEEFPAFVSWWKKQKAAGSFPSGGGIIETGNVLLNAREVAKKNPLYNHSEAVAEGPRFKGDSSFQGKLDALDPEYAKSIGTFDSSLVSGQAARGEVASSSGSPAPPIPGPTSRPPGYRKDIAGAGLAPSKLFQPKVKKN